MATTPDIAATTPRLGRYEIDPARSTLAFRTRHLFGLAPVRGSFAIRGGTVDIAEPFTDSAVHAEIETASFRTRNPQRDAAVLARRVLDAEHHPVISFDSESFGSESFDSERPGTRDITGTLTVRGVTRAVRLQVTDVTLARGSFTAAATARIDRTEFGVTAYRGLAGRYLDMLMEVQCVRTS
jgi:polyisoprenoid-binding protein YceI